MEVILINLFQSLENNVDDEIRLNIYRDLIPVIEEFDPEMFKDLLDNDLMFNQAYSEHFKETEEEVE